MNTLTVIAHIRARSGQTLRVRTELEKLIVPTRSEPGCLQYDLHQDNRNPACFTFLEQWVSTDHWQQHMDGQPLQDYLAAVEGAVASFTLHQMTRIG